MQTGWDKTSFVLTQQYSPVAATYNSWSLGKDYFASPHWPKKTNEHSLRALSQLLVLKSEIWAQNITFDLCYMAEFIVGSSKMKYKKKNLVCIHDTQHGSY